MHSWRLKQCDIESYKEIFSGDNQNFTSLAVEDNVPESIRQWLGRLCLLYGLPFEYLVPREEMLPMESIRFFYIDPYWVKMMLDGATSIGRITSTDVEHDKGFRDLLYNLAMKESQTGMQTGQIETDSNTSEPESRTGFLLRSALVTHWPGIQVKAFAQKESTQTKVELPILRMERLATDTLLCIFSGVFQRVELHQPPESVYFGAECVGNEYSVQLRNLGNKIGEQVDQQVKVPMRKNAPGVVDVESLVGLLKDHLGQEITSAELAVQMIEGVNCCVFENNE